MALILLNSMTAGSFSTQVYERRLTMSAHTGLSIFVTTRLAHCVTDWISFGRIVPCLLKLRLHECSLCVLQLYAPNAETKYHPFLHKVGVALQKVTSTESIVILGDFNAHVDTDDKTCKGVIR